MNSFKKNVGMLLNSAMKNTESESSKKIIDMLNDVMKLSYTHTRFGISNQSSMISQKYALIRKLGVHTTFDTYTFDFNNNPNIICMCEVPKDNVSYQAVCTSNCKEFQQIKNEKDPYSYKNKVKMTQENVVSMSYEYSNILDAYNQFSLKVVPSVAMRGGKIKCKTTINVFNQDKGIYGTTLATCGANDYSKSGRMNLHTLHYTLGGIYQLHALQDDPVVIKACIELVKNQKVSELSRQVAVFDLIRHWIDHIEDPFHIKLPRLRANSFITPISFSGIPSVKFSPNEYSRHCNIHAGRTQFHFLHGSRCFEGLMGKT